MDHAEPVLVRTQSWRRRACMVSLILLSSGTWPASDSGPSMPPMSGSWMATGGLRGCDGQAAGRGAGACVDLPTPDGFACEQQKLWGKCGDDWLVAGGYCEATCGVCERSEEDEGEGGSTAASSADGDCEDAPTPDGFSCEEQKSWGKCEDDWLRAGRYCRATCELCEASEPISLVATPGSNGQGGHASALEAVTLQPTELPSNGLEEAGEERVAPAVELAALSSNGEVGGEGVGEDGMEAPMRPPPTEGCLTVWDILNEMPMTLEFRGLVRDGSRAKTILSNPRAVVTVFVPDVASFQNASNDDAAQTALHHIVSGRVPSWTLSVGSQLESLGNNPSALTIVDLVDMPAQTGSQGPVVQAPGRLATSIFVDVEACNAIVHFVDSPLHPPAG